MDRAAFAQHTRDYITDYVKFGDSKAGAVLALAVVVGGLIGTVGDKLATLDAPPDALTAAAVAGLATIVSTTMVVIRCIEALNPDTTPAERSLASFPDIAQDPAKFLAECAVATPDDVSLAYERHVAVLATIATKKFHRIRQAVWWLRVQILAAGGLVVLYLVIKFIAE